MLTWRECLFFLRFFIFSGENSRTALTPTITNHTIELSTFGEISEASTSWNRMSLALGNSLLITAHAHTCKHTHIHAHMQTHAHTCKHTCLVRVHTQAHRKWWDHLGDGTPIEEIKAWSHHLALMQGSTTGSKGPWTEASKTKSQNQSFFPDHPKCFVTGMEWRLVKLPFYPPGEFQLLLVFLIDFFLLVDWGTLEPPEVSVSKPLRLLQWLTRWSPFSSHTHLHRVTFNSQHRKCGSNVE